MKKLSFLLLVVFVSFFILAWCSKKTNVQEDSNEINQNSELNQEDSNEYEEVVTTLEKLYENWWEKTCKFVINQNWMSMEWTIYIDWESMKTEAQTNINWMSVQGNTLIKDGYTYTRDDEQAWKIRDDEDEYEDDYEDEYEDDDIENVDMVFKCKNSISDKSILEVPNDIDFKEFNDMAWLEYMDDLEDRSY